MAKAFAPTIPTIAGILVAMAIIAFIETAVPLHARGRWDRIHVRPNMALTFLTFGTNAFLNAAVATTLLWLQTNGFGLLRLMSLRPIVAGVIAVLLLDFSFYVAHVAMHTVPCLWRYHRVHHADPTVDVTTSIRQHPGESVIRYAFMGAFALALGASPGAFAVYRVWSALNGLLEHANVRAPLWLDRALSLVTTWPHLHKIHHSRTVREANTNFGNITSLFDRLFRTFTPSRYGVNVTYGLDGFDDPASQTTLGLLAMPFRERPASRRLGSYSDARLSSAGR